LAIDVGREIGGQVVKCSAPTGAAMTKIDDVEYLRGVAILAVLGAHIANLTTLHRFLPAWLGGGGAGVQLFFVISGFVVGRSLIRSLDGAASQGSPRRRVVVAFYCRRVFRLAPMAAVSIVTALALHSGYRMIGIGSLAPFWRDLEMIATLRLNYGLVDEIRQHPLAIFWSLMVEEHFYLALPLILIGVRSFRLRTVLAVAIVVGTVAVLRPIQFSTNEPLDVVMRRILYATHLALDFFSAGLLVAIFDAVRGRLNLWAWRLPLRLLSMGLMLFIVGIGQSWTGGDLLLLMPGLLAASTALVFLAAQDGGVVLPPGPLRSVLRYLGSRSYGLYLFHYPILLWFQYVARGLASSTVLDIWDFLPVFGAMASTVALVEFLHGRLEQPLIDRGTALAARILVTSPPKTTAA
jgi:peptidoglycan/LPS O-acetylase OafA/YrhL